MFVFIFLNVKERRRAAAATKHKKEINVFFSFPFKSVIGKEKRNLISDQMFAFADSKSLAKIRGVSKINKRKI